MMTSSTDFSLEFSCERLKFLRLTFPYFPWRVQALHQYPDVIYLLKVNNRDTRTICEIRSDATIDTPKKLQWRRSNVYIVNLEQISYIALFSLLNLNKYMPAKQILFISQRWRSIWETWTGIVSSKIECVAQHQVLILSNQTAFRLLTHIMPLVSFHVPCTSEVFWCFQGVQKESSGIKCC